MTSTYMHRPTVEELETRIKELEQRLLSLEQRVGYLHQPSPHVVGYWPPITTCRTEDGTEILRVP